MGWLTRNLALLAALAGSLLVVFETTDHRAHVLPADASPLGVILGTILCAVLVSLVETALRKIGNRSA